MPAPDSPVPKDWRPAALWLALGTATVVLILRIVLDSSPAQAAAVAALAGVIVFGLAYVANERRPLKRATPADDVVNRSIEQRPPG